MTSIRHIGKRLVAALRAVALAMSLVLATILTVALAPSVSVAAETDKPVDDIVQKLLAGADHLNAGDRYLRHLLTGTVQAVQERAGAPGADPADREAWRALTHGVTTPAEDQLFHAYQPGKAAKGRAIAALHIGLLTLVQAQPYTGPGLFFDQARLLDPELAPAWLMSARLALRWGRAQDTMHMVQQAEKALTGAAHRGALARLQIIRAQVAAAQGSATAAAGALQQAAEIAEKAGQPRLMNDAMIRLAMLWLDQGQTTRAETVLQPVRKQASTDARNVSIAVLAVAEGRLQLQQGKMKSGIARLTEARAAAATRGDRLTTALAARYLAMASMKSGDHAGAQQYLDQAGKTYQALSAHDGQAAILTLRAALAAHKEQPAAACDFRRQARLALLRDGQWSAAMRVEQAIRQHKCLTGPMDALIAGNMTLPVGDAIPALTEAQKKTLSTMESRAISASLDGKTRDAATAFAAMVRIDPLNARAWTRYGRMLAGLELFAAALAAQANAVTIAGTTGDERLHTSASLGTIYTLNRIGRWADAEKRLRRLTAADSKSLDMIARGELARVQARIILGRGDLVEHEKVLRYAYETHSQDSFYAFTSRMLYHLGVNQHRRGVTNETVPILRRAIRGLDTGQEREFAADAAARIGAIQQATGLHKQACTWWKQSAKAYRTLKQDDHVAYITTRMARAGCG